jgi:hypothetical protein
MYATTPKVVPSSNSNMHKVNSRESIAQRMQVDGLAASGTRSLQVR